MIEVIFNDPPPPPPNDVPPLDEEDADSKQTIRERFVAHRANPSCAGCHARIDPLGFALENLDGVGRWRDKYRNGRPVDATGKLLRRHEFQNAVEFKQAIAREEQRFARALVGHLLRFALVRELEPRDLLVVDDIVGKAAVEDFKLRSIIKHVALSKCFVGQRRGKEPAEPESNVE